ncbi:unnamed protein product [Musa acuminata subsp. malaccensis]|uniref:(wild Malaysian banana) hypothetical protein n=1 Tax=Musa acuminata subsp. malaccensis TaxID=214687 RepID=A0A8D6ZV37_MUSAM|nr:unnamed protein product [Musa acuminata subsp. malaccensis]
MEVEFAVSVEVVGSDHGLALLHRPLVPQPAQHPLQPPRRDPPRPLHRLKHLERLPQLLLLPLLRRLPSPPLLHQPHEVFEVQQPVPVRVKVRDGRLRRRHRHLLPYRHEGGPELVAGDPPISVLIEVPKHLPQDLHPISSPGSGRRIRGEAQLGSFGGEPSGCFGHDHAGHGEYRESLMEGEGEDYCRISMLRGNIV